VTSCHRAEARVVRVMPKAQKLRAARYNWHVGALEFVAVGVVPAGMRLAECRCRYRDHGGNK